MQVTVVQAPAPVAAAVNAVRSDDSYVTPIVRKLAIEAGVDDCITFEVKDFNDIYLHDDCDNLHSRRGNGVNAAWCQKPEDRAEGVVAQDAHALLRFVACTTASNRCA